MFMIHSCTKFYTLRSNGPLVTAMKPKAKESSRHVVILYPTKIFIFSHDLLAYILLEPCIEGY
jgi:hypothetical protein